LSIKNSKGWGLLYFSYPMMQPANEFFKRWRLEQQSAKTTGIYAGCPVGPYRRHVVAAVVNSVASLLDRG
jgi:hypothetical protein